jgi:two-component system OmpR family response regulator
MGDQHILVVDDERDYGSMMADALRDAGFRVSVAWDQNEAMRILTAGEDPDLVVTDVMMGHLSEGFDLARAIRGRPDGRRIPVVILSGVRELYDVYSQVGEEWLDYDAFLDKPVSPDDLVTTVTTILEGANR